MTHKSDIMDYPSLQTLWCEDRPNSLQCLICRNPFTKDRSLIRTFKIQPHGTALERHSCSNIITLPGELIAIYDRCLGCLVSSKIEYITISHVWDSEVSKAQNAGRDTVPSTNAQTSAFTLPIKVYHGIFESLGKDHEIWHDYISVPQWTEDLKRPILRTIPQLYSKAFFTLVHLHDVPPRAVQSLRADASEDRIRGMTEICNGVWFRRIWTAMEYVRSERVRVMLEDYRIANDVEDLFLGEMAEVWAEETRRQGNVHNVERMTTDNNLVAWRLGPLKSIGALRETSFGHAFSLLSRRLCTQKHDFFYALLGIVKAELDESIDEDDRQACRQIAKQCLEVGDYSPLLMLPRFEARHRMKLHGYHDVRPWGLGQELSSSPIQNGLVLRPTNLTLKAEKIGIIKFARKFQSLAFDEPTMLAHLASIVLDYTGPDLVSFVSTLGTRMCGQNTQEILAHLQRCGKRRQLKTALLERYNSPRKTTWPIEGESGIKWIAEAIGLSDMSLTDKAERMGGDTPLGFIRARGGTIHGGDTGAIIGVACQRCRETFLFRAALSKRPSGVLSALAYRIPGLDYGYSLKDGVGVIVQDEVIIGRMVWARPACECREIEDVELEYPDWEMPDPNKFSYGGR